jgi:hypothetical protein
MKHFLMTPDYKKSMVEYTRFTKMIDGVNTHLVQEVGYRGGEILLHVPETLEEVHEWLFTREMTYEDAVESFGAKPSLWPFLPTSDMEYIDVDDYDNEFMQAYDGCWSDWSINQYTSLPDISDKDHGIKPMTVEEKDEMLESIYSIYDEGDLEAIEEDGWEISTCHWEIHCGVTLEECDERGNILDEELEDDD